MNVIPCHKVCNKGSAQRATIGGSYSTAIVFLDILFNLFQGVCNIDLWYLSICEFHLGVARCSERDGEGAQDSMLAYAAYIVESRRIIGQGEQSL